MRGSCIGAYEMRINDEKRRQSAQKGRIIAILIVIPFPLIGILLIPLFNLEDYFYYAISIPAVIMAGVTSTIIIERLVDRDRSTFFGRIVVFLNDSIWGETT
jgi:hypothetical protein